MGAFPRKKLGKRMLGCMTVSCLLILAVKAVAVDLSPTGAEESSHAMLARVSNRMTDSDQKIQRSLSAVATRREGLELELSELDGREQLDSDEVLMLAYEQTPPHDLNARWSIIEELGQRDSTKSAEFLASIALQPMPDPPGQPSAGAGEGSTEIHGCTASNANYWLNELAPRMWSAGALSRRSVRVGVDRLHEGLTLSILSSSSEDVAEYAAVTLFSQGALTDDHKTLLRQRGLGYEFRVLSDAERDEKFNSLHATNVVLDSGDLNE